MMVSYVTSEHGRPVLLTSIGKVFHMLVVPFQQVPDLQSEVLPSDDGGDFVLLEAVEGAGVHQRFCVACPGLLSKSCQSSSGGSAYHGPVGRLTGWPPTMLKSTTASVLMEGILRRGSVVATNWVRLEMVKSYPGFAPLMV